MLARDVHVFLTLAVALASGLARGQVPPAPTCPVTIRTYALASVLQVSGTPGGRADGAFAVGPGTAVLRFQDRNVVEMLSFELSETFTVHVERNLAKVVLVTHANSAAAPDACGVVATGALDRHTVRWQTPLRAYRTDGVVTCWGPFCDSFGTPTPGQTPLHAGPAPQPLADFVLSADGKTLTMATTPSSRFETPRQTWSFSLVGHELAYACARVTPCGRR